MKILHIGLSSNPGGIETLVYNFYKRMVSSDVLFDFLDVYGDGLSFSDEIVKIGGNIFTITNYKKNVYKACKEFRDLITNTKYDIIHFHVLSAGMYPLIVIAKNNAKTIVHSHNTNTESGIFRNIVHYFNLPFLRKLNVEKWACGFEAGKWLWGKDFCRDNIINNAIDNTLFTPNLTYRKEIREKYGIGEDQYTIGFVGHFCEQKNVFFLIKILEELVKYDESKFIVLAVGDGPLLKQVNEKANNLKLNNNIIFVGKKSNVNEYYSAMDCFILPSLFEGFPVVGIEAQAAKLPCFFSNTITKEIDISNKSIFLPIDDPEKWAKEIVKCPGKVLSNFPNSYNINFAKEVLKEKYIQVSGDLYK